MDGPDSLKDHMKRNMGNFVRKERKRKGRKAERSRKRGRVGSGLAREQCLHAGQGEYQRVLTGGQVVRETLAGSRECARTVGSRMHGLEALAGSQDGALARGQECAGRMHWL